MSAALATPSRALADLGFTAVEAEVYLFLVQESPATGYRVSQALGRPASQIYRTLEALERKDAVLAHGGKGRRYRPVPMGELVAQLRDDFDRRAAQAVEAVKEVPPLTSDELVYRLRSRPQVFQRCCAMLDRCRSVAILDLFPVAVEPLQKAISAATDRGVATIVKVYRPGHLNATLVATSLYADSVVEGWPGQQITVVTDAREFLFARFSRDGGKVLTAFWSENTSFASSIYNGKLCEIGFVTLEREVASGVAHADLLATAESIRRYALSRNQDLLDGQ